MENLKALRNAKGMTQAQVAKECKVSLTSYRLWEQGVTEPNAENKSRLEKLFSNQ